MGIRTAIEYKINDYLRNIDEEQKREEQEDILKQSIINYLVGVKFLFV